MNCEVEYIFNKIRLFDANYLSKLRAIIILKYNAVELRALFKSVEVEVEEAINLLFSPAAAAI
jgi:hypothetical protein